MTRPLMPDARSLKMAKNDFSIAPFPGSRTMPPRMRPAACGDEPPSAYPPDVSARDAAMAGLLARGSLSVADLPGCPVVMSGDRLAAYSCGCSRGLGSRPLPRSLSIPLRGTIGGRLGKKRERGQSRVREESSTLGNKFIFGAPSAKIFLKDCRGNFAGGHAAPAGIGKVVQWPVWSPWRLAS